MVGQRLGCTAEMAVRKGCVVFETAADLPREGAYFGAPCSRFVLTTPPPNRFRLSAYRASTRPSCVNFVPPLRQVGGMIFYLEARYAL